MSKANGDDDCVVSKNQLNDSDLEDEEDEDYVPGNAGDENSSEDSVDEDEDLEKKSEHDSTKTVIDKDKLDKIWEEFTSMPAKSSTNDENNKKTTTEPEKVTVIQEYDFAGETVVVKKQVDKSSLANDKDQNKNCDVNKNNPKPAAIGTKRNSGGVSALLSQLKKPKMNTLKKSLLDWQEYKESNNIEEELDQNRRSKGSFIERQAFLSRTDLREFEQEKSVRDRIRNLRDSK